MTDAPVTNTVITNILKVRYPESKVQDLCYRQQAVLPWLKKTNSKISGKNWSWSMQAYRSSSSRFQAEGAAEVDVAVGQYLRDYIDGKSCVTAQQLTAESIADSGDDLGSLFQTVVRIPQEIARDHAFHIARNAWAVDAYGAIAQCGASASTTVQLATNANMRKFHKGMVVDLRTQSTGVAVTNGDSITLTSYSEANKTITYSGSAATVTSLVYVYVEDEMATGPVTRCPLGIPTWVSSTSISQLDPATYQEAQSSVNTATGTLTLAKIQKEVDWVEARNEGKVDAIFASPEVIIKYADILLPDVRYRPEDLGNWQAGYPTNLFYRGGTMGVIPIIKDALMPTDEMYILSSGSFRNFYSAWLEWFALDGSRFSRVPGYMNYEMKMWSRFNLACLNRTANAKLAAITI